MLLRAKITYLKVVAWIGLVFFLSCAIGALASKQADAVPLFLPFVLLSLYFKFRCCIAKPGNTIWTQDAVVNERDSHSISSEHLPFTA
jgi:hypothetical protein